MYLFIFMRSRNQFIKELTNNNGAQRFLCLVTRVEIVIKKGKSPRSVRVY